LAAVAVAEVVSETCKVDARIKWPNDVRINRCKIAGILVERNNGSVIGIGLNVNAAESDFPEELILQTTSMSRLSGRGFDRSEITKELLRRLDHWYLKGITDGPDSLDAPVRERSEHINRLVEVETSKGPVTGRLAAIEVGRGITLVAPDGILIRINGREVRALKEVESI
jgi:BirA family biotin operon repressor/biotin-[acetyl-CoA-carboxylase] ligase